MSLVELTERTPKITTLTKPNGSDATAAAISVNGLKSVIGSAVSLGIGQVVSMLASFFFFAYLSRYFGVEMLGIVVLAQTVAQYVTLGTDQGLRLVGARLVARGGNAAPFIIDGILQKRLLSCAVCVVVGIAYAEFGPVPNSARPYILGLVMGVIPYAFSLDWLAWGLNKFAWLGGFNGGVKLLFVIGSVVGIMLTKTALVPITLANGIAATVGAVVLWTVWHFQWRPKIGDGTEIEADIIQKEVRWFAVLPLGMATILNQAFHNLDTVLLGAMSTAREVGRYGSAYKILFVILGAYWLITSSLYPKFACAKGGAHARKVLFRVLVLLTISGAALAILIHRFAAVILSVVYGSDLGATRLLQILVFAIPLDFCVALLGTLLVSRGHDRATLVATGSAAAVNVIINLLLIPRFQAMGAAIATLVSYVYLFGFLLQHTVRKPVFAEAASWIVP